MTDANRRQTTRGVWLSKAKNQDVLVMDVEGTDGRERGEDQEFERRSALFSLAVAEVIIINLWENMVGLYNGANMGLLKTVFEVNLQLFHSNQSRTLLYFVIRDHIGMTPLANLEKVMLESLENIWTGLNKPASLKDSKIKDFFDIEFAALPHKLLQPEKFEQDVEVLRQRFVDKTHKQFVFQKQYHKNIPADGVPVYTQQIWERIIDSKDLDLPTQQQLLAQYRCDEISAESFEKFISSTKRASSMIDAGEVYDEFESLSEERKFCLTLFESDASRYHEEVYLKKKAELLRKVNGHLFLLFNSQIKNIRKTAIHAFKTAVQNALTNKSEGDDFATHLTLAQKESEEYFLELVKEAILPETSWNCDEDISSFKEELQDLSSKIRIEELEKLAKKLEKAANKQLHELLASEFASSSQDMWVKVLGGYNGIVDEVLSKFKKRAKKFLASDEEISNRNHLIGEMMWDGFRTKINEELSDQMMQLRLKQKFEDSFRYTEEGLPRVWQDNSDTLMEECFLSAKEQADNLIALFTKIPIDDSQVNDFIAADEDYDSSQMAVILLPPSRQRHLKERLRKDAETVFTEVKRGAIASLSEIPQTMWILLLILGFNEIYAVMTFLFSNPITMIFVVLIAGTLAFLYQSGMLMPAMQVAIASARPFMQIALASAGPALEAAASQLAAGLSQVADKLSQLSKNADKSSRDPDVKRTETPRPNSTRPASAFMTPAATLKERRRPTSSERSD